MKWLTALATLLLSATLALAQVPLPQTVNPPLVPNGLDSSGNFTSRQLSQFDISTPLATSTSASTFLLQTGLIQFALDNPTQFAVGYGVQITSLNDPSNWAICIITAIDATGFTSCNTTIIQGGGIYDNNWFVQTLNGSTLEGIPTWAGLGADGIDTITIPSTLGTTVNMTVATGLVFDQNAIVYVWAPQDQVASWFVASVISYNSATGALSLFVTKTSNSGTTWSLFYVSLVNFQGPNAALIGYSATNATTSALGTAVMTVSLPGAIVSPPSLVVGHYVPFVTQAGQFFPVDGQILASCLSNPALRAAGQVWAYNGATLTLLVTAVYGSGACNAWSLYLDTGPTTRIPYYSMAGLQITQPGTQAGTSQFTVQAGSIRDFTDNIDLVVPASLTFDLTNLAYVQTVAGPGTISTSGTTVTGSSTTFTTTFNPNSPPGVLLTDLKLQYQAINGVTPQTVGAIIGVTGKAASISSVGSDTSLSTSIDSLGVGGGTSYTRGGVVSHLNTGAYLIYAIVLARKDSTGFVQVFASSNTLSGTPDLPAGYTYYRSIGMIRIAWNGASSYFTVVIQPLRTSNLQAQGDIQYLDSAFAYTRLALGTTNNVLTVGVNGVSGGAAPVWGQVTLSDSNAVTGTLAVGNGGTGATGCSTIAALPGSPTTGMRACINNGSVSSCTFGNNVTTTGAVFCPVIYNGTTWQAG